MLKTVIIPVSPNTLDRLRDISPSSRYYDVFSKDNDGSNTSLIGNVRRDRRRLMHRVKKLRIIANRFFCDTERLLILFLLTSATPMNDFRSMGLKGDACVWRFRRYVRYVAVEISIYMEKKTYRKIMPIMRRLLTNREFLVFQMLTVSRNMAHIGRMLGLSRWMVWKVTNKIEAKLVAGKDDDICIHDLLVTWNRVKLLRYRVKKTYNIDNIKNLGGRMYD